MPPIVQRGHGMTGEGGLRYVNIMCGAEKSGMRLFLCQCHALCWQLPRPADSGDCMGLAVT